MLVDSNESNKESFGMDLTNNSNVLCDNKHKSSEGKNSFQLSLW